MGYKYYPEPDSNLSASSILIEHFQAAVTDLFEVSSDIYNIEEEVTFGSELFKFIKVRITSALDVLTQTRLGDDFKRILFLISIILFLSGKSIDFLIIYGLDGISKI